MKIENPPTSATPFSHAEWAHSNLENFRMSEAARQRSEEVRNQTVRLVEDRERRTARSQQDATNRLNERTRDVTVWRRELQRELQELMKETQKLEDCRRELEHAQQQIKRPEEVINHCKAAREYRVGTDNVKDGVAKSLDTEMRDVKRLQEAMKQHHDLADAQITTNEIVMTALKQDLAHKDQAIDIDTTCFQLETNSHELAFRPGINQADLTKSSPQSWVKYSDKNIEDSTNARFKSGELRGNIDSLLSTSCTELMTAWSATNRNFKERIMETEEVQHQLQKNLQSTLEEIVDLDAHIEMLKKALKAKEPPLKLAETRLEFRAHRPNVEACHDAPHGKLVEEVDEIKDTVSLLSQQLNEAEVARANLIQARAALRQDIRVKENSLRIDRGKCMGSRLRFPYNQRCGRKCMYRWCQAIAAYIMAKTADGLHLADTDLRQYDGGHCA